jgi:hypothetical protein
MRLADWVFMRSRFDCSSTIEMVGVSDAGMNKEEKIHEPQSRHPRSSLVGVRLLARDPETRFTGDGNRTTALTCSCCA